MKKRILTLLIATGLCLSIIASFMVSAGAFSDVSNSETAEAVEVLSGLGVVSGYSDGGYHPAETLTRAQFCKMVILAEGNGDLVNGSAYRTLFSDVPGSNWAAPYINRAYEEGLVSGYGNGTFGPNDSVTTGQAVTVVLRMLGYTAEEIGPFWPEDDMQKAAELDLLDGLSAGANQALTRGDAALLLYHLLQQNTADGTDYVNKLCTTTVKDAVLIDNDAQADDGTLHTAMVYAGGSLTYYVQDTAISDSLTARRGTLLLNKSGQISGFLPDETLCKSLYPAKTTASAITDGDGGSYTIKSSTVVILDGEKQTYGDCWYELQGRSQVTLYYASGGGIDLVTASDAVAYEGVLLTGYYENASPNAASPSRITMLGMTLDVNDSALSSLSKFSVGDRLTVALNGKGEVAAAYQTSEKRTELFGLLENTSGTITLTCGLTASGTLSGSSAAQGDLVRVTATGIGKLSVSQVSSTTAHSLNVTARTLGTVPVSDQVKVYERVGNSKAVQIDWDDILVSSVPAANIDFYTTGTDGKVSVLLLDDVTGNAYTYGLMTTGSDSGGSGEMSYLNRTVSIENADGTSKQYVTTQTIVNDTYGGIAVSAEDKAVGAVTLKQAEGVRRSDFDDTDAVIVEGVLIPISDDVQVYNTQSDQWTTLSQAKSFADTFTVYYDRTPETGGVVRVITTA